MEISSIKKKRGRKPKNQQNQQNQQNQDNLQNLQNQDNLQNLQNQDNLVQDNLVQDNPVQDNLVQDNLVQDNLVQDNPNQDNLNQENQVIKKKRGRKPKGGTIITNIEKVKKSVNNEKKNIVLHLKCKLQDIKENIYNISDVYKNDEIKSYVFNKNLEYEILNEDLNCTSNINNNSEPNITNNLVTNNSNNYNEKSQKIIIDKKLKELNNNLHSNNLFNKRSACFYCTYDFHNVPIYIPKYEINQIYYVYGCFCSPECACGYLFEQNNIDTTSMFERYYLLNYLYTKVYDYKKNIKPAPNPYYLLDKFSGNLTIQEYRELLDSERLLIVIDKPLVRQFPELHEDNEICTIKKYNTLNNINCNEKLECNTFF